jgi:hydroxypyruvate isomerase
MPLMDAARLNRREFVEGAAGTLGAAAVVGAAEAGASTASAHGSDPALKGRIRQSLCVWNFAPLTAEDLAREAVALGLKSLELLGPEHFPMLARHGLTCAIFGRHGFSKGFAHREEHAECTAACLQAIDEAAAFGAPNIITFSGFSRGIGREAGVRHMIEGLKGLAAHAEKRGVTVCLEMLNSRVDVPMKGHPDYFCDDIDLSVDIVKAVSSERVKVLFDLYHVQIMHGDVSRRIRQHAPWIGHVHTAGNPGRCDLDAPDQELNYPALMKVLVEVGYRGFVGQEFIPRAGDKAGNRKAIGTAVRLCDV